MIKSLRLQNFKSWADPPAFRLAPITGLFGANSSGKSSITQLLLLLKQTAESLDRTRVLHLGDERSLVDLGTFYDLVYRHEVERPLDFLLAWQQPKPLKIADPATLRATLVSSEDLAFGATIVQEGSGDQIRLAVHDFEYEIGAETSVGMEQRDDGAGYDLTSTGIKLGRRRGRPWPLPPPIKCYGFPDQVANYYRDADFTSDLSFAFEELMSRITYVGPLRENPLRVYRWGGERPASVGVRGELAVEALLAARAEKRSIGRGQGRGRRYTPFEEVIATWLQRIGMINSFSVRAIGRNRKEYEVRVRKSRGAPEVLITDVGFGVSQVLPIVVQLFYAAEGSIVILEQPELHLHPRVQSELADVIIEAVLERNLQVLIESHSEHLLRRLQLRIAEEEGRLSPSDVSFYFTEFDRRQSVATKLDVDLFGNITNWPTDFFGDELGELTAMTMAAAKRGR